jgi:hypothetical protein
MAWQTAGTLAALLQQLLLEGILQVLCVQSGTNLAHEEGGVDWGEAVLVTKLESISNECLHTLGPAMKRGGWLVSSAPSNPDLQVLAKSSDMPWHPQAASGA